MDKPRFSFFKRRNGYYYYQVWDEDKRRYGIAHTTHKRSKRLAERYIYNQPTSFFTKKRNDELFLDFLTKYWTYSESPYVKNCAARKKTLSTSYFKMCLSFIRKNVLPYEPFNGLRLDKVKAHHIEDFIQYLVDKNTLSGKSINHIITAIQSTLKYAYKLNYTSDNFTSSISKIYYQPKEKGILSIEEIKRLFGQDNSLQDYWKGNLKHYLLNLVAFVCGGRLGEVEAMKWECIRKNEIIIISSWDGVKVKETKTRSSRRICPIRPEIYSLLTKLHEKEGDSIFVFSGREKDKPLSKKPVENRLSSALFLLGITDDDRKNRNISFNSWRHAYNTYLKNRGMTDDAVNSIIGHSTIAMTKYYSHLVKGDYTIALDLQKDILLPASA